MLESEINELNVCKIKIIGVGGAGGNAVNRMLDMGVNGEFAVINTDKQALMLSKCAPENRIQIGKVATQGLGAGSYPQIGEKAAEESVEELEKLVDGINLLFITAGMGGGTGTGAAPVLARIAKEKGCVTVAVVTRPFAFEAKRREDNAKQGIANLTKYVDTLIVIPNDKLLESLSKDTPLVEALRFADDNLRQAICGIADLITVPGLINLDFADIRTVIKGQGLAHMGVGRGRGEHRIVEAVRQAVASPMLETTIEGARSVLLNIAGDDSLTLGDVNEAATLVHSVVDFSANIIWGTTTIPELKDEVTITIIATGFTDNPEEEEEEKRDEAKPVAPVFEKKPVESIFSESPKPIIEDTITEDDDDNESEEDEGESQESKKELPPFVRKLFGKK